MSKKFILRLPPKSKILVYTQILWVLVMLWLRDVARFPSLITYLTDVFMVSSLVLQINRIRRNIRLANTKTQSKIVLAILSCIAIGIILNLVKPLLVIWAARNNLRFYVFFYICIGVLNIEDIDKILVLLKKFFWMNVALCTCQYFVMGLKGDHLGGFFGTTEGCNAFMNILLCCICANVFAEYGSGKFHLGKLVLYLAFSLYIAVLSELKFFYVEVVLMVMVFVIYSKPSVKTVLMCLLSLLAGGLLILVLAEIDPHSLTILLDEQALIRYIAGNGYTSSGDINRLTAIPQIQSRFFAGNLLRTLFGFGFGNCETSKFDFLNSDFFMQYGHLNYRWFTHAWVFLEQGILGLSLLFIFFFSLLMTSIKMKHSIRPDLALTATIFISTCILGMIYNCSIQLEIGYLMAVMVAIPFILKKQMALGPK